MGLSPVPRSISQRSKVFAMGSVEVKADARPAWVLSQPWFWGYVGLAANGLAVTWVQALQNEVAAVRFSLVAIGLLSTLAAVQLSFGSSRPLLRIQPLAILGLAFSDLVLAAATTILLFAHLTDAPGLPWSTASVLWLWIVAAPWCGLRAVILLRHRANR